MCFTKCIVDRLEIVCRLILLINLLIKELGILVSDGRQKTERSSNHLVDSVSPSQTETHIVSIFRTGNHEKIDSFDRTIVPKCSVCAYHNTCPKVVVSAEEPPVTRILVFRSQKEHMLGTALQRTVPRVLIASVSNFIVI